MALENAQAYQEYEFTITAGAVTPNIAISPDVDLNSRFEVESITATVSFAATTAGGVGVRVGFGLATLPAASGVASTPATNILLSHSGFAPGSGMHGIPGIGGRGEELRATVTDPTVGSVVINFRGRIVPVGPLQS